MADDTQPAVLEERRGDIEFRVVNNDGKDYIARLVYDRSHLSMAIVKHPLEVVGYVISAKYYPGVVRSGY